RHSEESGSGSGLMHRAEQARHSEESGSGSGLMHRAEQARHSEESGSGSGLMQRAEQARHSDESGSGSGLMHRTEQARHSEESGSGSGLMHRAEQARQSESSGSGSRSEPHPNSSTSSRPAPGSGSGLLNRALFMRESMKGLLARASAMRDSSGEESAGSDESRTSAGLQGSPFESREERSGSSASSDISTDRPAHTRESGSFESADTGPKSDVSGDNLASEAGPEYDQDSIVPDSDLHESVEFLDEEEFAQIAQEAEGGDFDQDIFEPEISSEALEDFQSPFDMAALEENDEQGFAPDDSTKSALEPLDLESDVESRDSQDFEDLERANSAEETAAEERGISEEDEFPDLDLEYRTPDESEDPATHQEEDSTDLVDPFSNWEQEALEQAEQEAHGLQNSPVPDRDESFLYEDTHPMTTLPAEAHIASQRKIDHYMALFDLLRELQDVEELEEFWDSLAYAILGQLGSSRVVIFAPHDSGKNQLFYPAAFLGVTPPDEWVLKPGDEIYDTLQKSGEIHYAQEFQKATSTISDLEKEILDSINAQIIAPIGHPGDNSGIIVIGPNMEGVDYTLDDLEYLKLLGEMSAGALDRIRQRMKREEQSEQKEARLELYERILSASREASQVKNLDDVYDVLLSHLKEDFSVESASLVLLNVPDQKYRIFAGNEISPESLEKFQLPVSSDLIGTISNLTRLYDFTDFRQNHEITSCYSNDDLALMQNYWIVPLINLNWLVGFITIHRTGRPWTEFDRELVLATSEFFAPILANCIILGERETLFRDPFSPVMERLRQELDRGAQFQTPVSLVEVRVKNLKRLLSLNEPDSVTSFLQDMSRSLGGLLFDTDFQARVGQGRFALILPGRNSQEADIFVRKVQAEFKRLNLLSRSPIDVQYAFQSVTSPDDARDAEKMLAYLDP
ncbi:MAG TPA: hypothetical protein DEA96_11485, partial [Leptospiraceae bacterium]|nr:hypothetical protein [Leptospiraceae bacterium]